MNKEVVKELDKWSVGESRVNHWWHEDRNLSIRATHPGLKGAIHIARTRSWVVEIYPADEWPNISGDNRDDVERWHPESDGSVKRLVVALMLSVAEHDAHK